MKNAFATLFISLMMTGLNAQTNNYNPLQSANPPQNTVKKIPPARVVIQPTDTSRTKEAKIIYRDNFVSVKMDAQENTNPQEFFQKYSESLGSSGADHFVFLQKETDKIGFTHSRFDHYYKGLRVIGSQIILHEKDGSIKSANGKFIRNLNLSVDPLISAGQAIDRSIQADGAEEYVWQAMGFERVSQDSLAVSKGNYPLPDLVIMFEESNPELYHVCYAVKICSTKPAGAFEYYVDIISGEIVNHISLYQNSSDVSGTANTLYYGTRNITMDSYVGAYRLRESGRPIQTMDLQNKTFYSPSNLIEFVNSSINWTTPEIMLDSILVTTINPVWTDNGLEDPANGDIPDLIYRFYNPANQLISSLITFVPYPLPQTMYVNSKMRFDPIRMDLWELDTSNPFDSLGSVSIPRTAGNMNISGSGNSGIVFRSAQNNPALDAHWGIEKSYDFFKYILGRNSYNDSGAIIKSCIHFNQATNNAYWNSDNKVLLIGDGDGSNYSEFTCLDIMGHEFTHGVIGATANLVYQGQSGALNESFADIFGTAIEFYSGISTNWTIGESITLKAPLYGRSLSDPNSGQDPQPDTYRGVHWYPPTQNWDHGGVHTNSGVQNFWFYLLCNGGSGTNDNGQGYNVTAIGMSSAQQIAYRTLVYYLSPGSDYLDSYTNSLIAADDLFGPNSIEVAAVRSAWWAVGIGNDPNAYCHGNTWYAWPYFSFSDGSNRADYNNNSNCTWLLAPTGADSLTLVFTFFDTENTYDSVIVYDGPNENFPVVTTWWGNTIPPPITSSAGALFVRFVTDNTQTRPGWSAYYVGYGLPACLGITTLTDASTTFEDGSGPDSYGNNSLCGWLIAPPCATSVHLNFNSFSTEAGYDSVYVYDGNALTSPLLWSGSGSTIPPTIHSSQGEMLVIFLSDFSVKYPGWSASYTSTGAPICSGVDVRSADSDLISDGSANNNYCNNLNCGWLIQPPDVNTISLNTYIFDLEPVDENQNYGDALEVYDGIDENAPLLGQFAGNSPPPPLVSTGPSMFVKFRSNYSINAGGFTAVYFSNTPIYCQALTTLTAASGNLGDGSNTNNYGNSSDCSWLIQPLGAAWITLSFNSFETENIYDRVDIYDGPDELSPLINSFSGTSLPASVSSTGGSMYIRFLSDGSIRRQGWEASYTSSTVGFNSISNSGIFLYPNPTADFINISCPINLSITKMELIDLAGRTVRKFKEEDCYEKTLHLSISGIAPGIYQLRINSKDGRFSLAVCVEGTR